MDFSRPWGYSVSRPAASVSASGQSDSIHLEWTDHHGIEHRALRPLQELAVSEKHARDAAAADAAAVASLLSPGRLTRKANRQFGSFMLAKNLAHRNQSRDDAHQAEPDKEVRAKQLVLDESSSPPPQRRITNQSPAPSTHATPNTTTRRIKPRTTPNISPRINQTATTTGAKRFNFSPSTSATTTAPASPTNQGSSSAQSSSPMLLGFIPPPAYVRPLAREQVELLRDRVDLLPPAFPPHPLSKDAIDPYQLMALQPSRHIAATRVQENQTHATAIDDTTGMPVRTGVRTKLHAPQHGTSGDPLHSSTAMTPGEEALSRLSAAHLFDLAECGPPVGVMAPLRPSKKNVHHSVSKAHQLQAELFAMVAPLQHSSMALTNEAMNQMKKIARALKETHSGQVSARAFPHSLRALAQQRPIGGGFGSHAPPPHPHAPIHGHPTFDDATQPLLDLLAPHVADSQAAVQQESQEEELQTKRSKAWKLGPGFDPKRNRVADELREAQRVADSISQSAHCDVPIPLSSQVGGSSCSLELFRRPSAPSVRSPDSRRIRSGDSHHIPYQSASTALARGGIEREETRMRSVEPNEIETVELESQRRHQSPNRCAAPETCTLKHQIEPSNEPARTIRQSQLRRPHAHTHFLVDDVPAPALFRAGLVAIEDVAATPTNDRSTSLSPLRSSVAAPPLPFPTRTGSRAGLVSRDRNSSSNAATKRDTFLNRSRAQSREVSPQRPCAHSNGSAPPIPDVSIPDHFPVPPSCAAATPPPTAPPTHTQATSEAGFLSALLEEIMPDIEAWKAQERKEREKQRKRQARERAREELQRQAEEQNQNHSAASVIKDASLHYQPHSPIPASPDLSTVDPVCSGSVSPSPVIPSSAAEILTIDHGDDAGDGTSDGVGTSAAMRATTVQRVASFEFTVGDVNDDGGIATSNNDQGEHDIEGQQLTSTALMDMSSNPHVSHAVASPLASPDCLVPTGGSIGVSARHQPHVSVARSHPPSIYTEPLLTDAASHANQPMQHQLEHDGEDDYNSFAIESTIAMQRDRRPLIPDASRSSAIDETQRRKDESQRNDRQQEDYNDRPALPPSPNLVDAAHPYVGPTFLQSKVDSADRRQPCEGAMQISTFQSTASAAQVRSSRSNLIAHTPLPLAPPVESSGSRAVSGSVLGSGVAAIHRRRAQTTQARNMLLHIAHQQSLSNTNDSGTGNRMVDFATLREKHIRHGYKQPYRYGITESKDTNAHANQSQTTSHIDLNATQPNARVRRSRNTSSTSQLSASSSRGQLSTSTSTDDINNNNSMQRSYTNSIVTSETHSKLVSLLLPGMSPDLYSPSYASGSQSARVQPVGRPPTTRLTSHLNPAFHRTLATMTPTVIEEAKAAADAHRAAEIEHAKREKRRWGRSTTLPAISNQDEHKDDTSLSSAMSILSEAASLRPHSLRMIARLQQQLRDNGKAANAQHLTPQEQLLATRLHARISVKLVSQLEFELSTFAGRCQAALAAVAADPLESPGAHPSSEIIQQIKQDRQWIEQTRKQIQAEANDR